MSAPSELYFLVYFMAVPEHVLFHADRDGKSGGGFFQLVNHFVKLEVKIFDVVTL
jgi:hypothetical protein